VTRRRKGIVLGYNILQFKRLYDQNPKSKLGKV
jgi:hypothetical protein